MKKGDIFKINGKEKFMQLVGYWGEDLILAPMGEKEDQVMVCSPEDIREYIDSGFLSKLHIVDMKKDSRE